MVKLLHFTPLYLIANGIRMSHDNHNLSDSKFIGLNFNNWNEEVKITQKEWVQQLTPTKVEVGEKDFDLIKKVGFKFKHESVLEHSLLVFELEFSRALLQELSRHRAGVSPTVKSTRYTLKELKDEDSFITYTGSGRDDYYVSDDNYDRVFDKYLIKSGDDYVDMYSILALENARIAIQKGISNDKVKYCLPESFRTKGQYSFNLRSLLHLLQLRIHKDALKEFRELCVDIINALPDEYKELVLLDETILKNYSEMVEEND